jgi:hypothetical protein
MTGKRKFFDATATTRRKKRAQTANNHTDKHEHSHENNRPVSHELLSLYYPRIVSLRQFLLSSLPLSSTSRRRRVSTYGSGNLEAARQTPFLDSTLIGVLSEPQTTVKEARQRDFTAFTQSQQNSTDNSNGSANGRRFAEVSFSKTRAGCKTLCCIY